MKETLRAVMMILAAVISGAVIIGGVFIFSSGRYNKLQGIEWPGVDPNRYGGFLFFYDCNDPNARPVYGDIVFVGECHHQLTLSAADDVVTLNGPDINDGLMGLYVLLSKGKQPTKQVTFQVKETKSQADEIDNVDCPPVETIDVNYPNFWLVDSTIVATSLTIGGIVIDLETGNVTISGDVNDASREFWQVVERNFKHERTAK